MLGLWDLPGEEVVNKLSKVPVMDQDGDLVRVTVGDEAVLVHVAQNTVGEVDVLLREHLLPLYQRPESVHQ